jgi:hypothetical protein
MKTLEAMSATAAITVRQTVFSIDMVLTFHRVDYCIIKIIMINIDHDK